MSDIEAQIKAVGLKHIELVRLLAEIEDVRPALKEQEVIITDLKSQMVKSELKLEKLDSSRRTHIKEHGKYRNSFMRRLLYKAGGKQEVFAELAEKQQREYLDAVSQAHEEQTLNFDLRDQIKKAEKTHTELKSTVQQRNNLERQLHDLHESIFSGPTPMFPKENAKKATLKEKLDIAQRMKAQDGTQAIAVKVLDEANQAMAFALNHFDEVLALKKDTTQHNPLLTNDFEYISALRGAEKGLQGAKDKIGQLPVQVAFLPKIPMETGVVSISDALDRLLGALRLQVDIHRGRGDAARCAVAIEEGLEQAKTRKKTLAAELQRAETDIERARLDLQEERQRIFKQVLTRRKSKRDGRGSRTNSPMPS
ncbi:hypothetical protein BGZ63DRAFT_424421 [Mariannaea sp. PMI_226]|nr:hypothetical protein BGZ63DRAFT_424421 [Mariannaea sp. PMI_226]